MEEPAGTEVDPHMKDELKTGQSEILDNKSTPRIKLAYPSAKPTG